MSVPNWNRCAQTMFDIMVGVHTSKLHMLQFRRFVWAMSLLIHVSCLVVFKALLEANQHITLTDTPPEDDRDDEPGAGAVAQASPAVSCCC